MGEARWAANGASARLQVTYPKTVVFATLAPVTVLLTASFPSNQRSVEVAVRVSSLTMLCGTLAYGIAVRSWDAIHLPLLAVLSVVAYCLPAVGVWPMPLVIVLAVYGALVGTLPQLRRTASYWRRGHLDRTTIVWMTTFTVVAAGALVAWRYGTNVDMARYISVLPRDIPRWAIFAGIVPLAMLNALFEEFLARGVLWQSCETAFGPRTALVVSSLGFGLAHYRGFPSGSLGVGLATVYGLMMGFVRLRTRGLFGPWIAHVIADVVIYVMVVSMIVFGY